MNSSYFLNLLVFCLFAPFSEAAVHQLSDLDHMVKAVNTTSTYQHFIYNTGMNYFILRSLMFFLLSVISVLFQIVGFILAQYLCQWELRRTICYTKQSANR